jgi:glutathione synthase/RimK-type ligase-like ATP-grasp enzyme
MINIIDRFLAFLYALSKINFIKLIQLQSKDADHIVWTVHEWFKPWKYDSVMFNDLATIKYLIDENIKFKIYAKKNIGKYTNKTIYLSLSRNFNPYYLQNWTASLLNCIQELENQGNQVFPCFTQAQWWENKEFMHQEFERLDIHCPKTVLCNEVTDFNSLNLNYPILYKDVHTSGSAGMFKITSNVDMLNIVEQKHKIGKYHFMLQEMVDMRSDLRVILIGEEIVLHYWRKNNDKEWKPTSTSGGSTADFENFPERWRQYIIDNFKKLNLPTGAFDITWHKDDISTEPYFLEVSPSYLPNPIPTPQYKNSSYSDYKKNLFIKNNYWKSLVNIMFEYKILSLRASKLK